METKTSLVRSDCTVELYTVSFVDLYVPVVIDPRNTERDDSFWLYQTLQDGKAAVFLLVTVDNNLKGIQNFFYCLMKFRFTRILCNDSFINFFCVRHDDFPPRLFAYKIITSLWGLQMPRHYYTRKW